MKSLAQNTLIQNRYLIVHLIGKGGMGEVYLAVDQRLGSAVALKRTYFAGDEMLGNAFEREARILARMRHPVLPKVSDHFGENDEQYLVMEHISGDDLAKRLELAQKPFPLSWVMFWADQLLDALSYLHSHEPPIIHRDIKPQNLKLTDENHIILLDFGLSKSSTGQTNISATSGGSTGSVVGYTPHYAPMEQIRGIGTNPRSDLYSLSATIYQLLTNIVPADALSRADALLNDSPDPIRPPHELNPEIPRAVSEVILKGMEVSQEKRFGDAREMQKVLRKAFTQIQEAMSAQTVAFNMQNDALPSLERPESISVPPPSPFGDKILSEPLRNDASTSIQPGGPGEFDSSPVLGGTSDSGIRQADVKTEVFLAGSIPFPEAGDSRAGDSHSGTQQPIDDFSKHDQIEFDSNPPPSNFEPEATVPLISFGNDAGNGSAGSAFDRPDSFPGEAASSQPNPFATVAASGQSYSAAPEQFSPEPRAKHIPKDTKSSSKVFAILGGLMALIVLAAGAGGAGWYIYTNYYGNMAETEATPTPEPTLEITPSPQPTIESVFDTNSNTGVETAGETNTSESNSQTDLTVAPTPEPAPEADTQTQRPRPTPNVATRNTPSRQADRPAPRATPAPKPREDRTRILQ